MKMKKYLTVLSMAVSAMFFAACMPAEVGFTEERFVENIFTVNKHTVAPEFADTTYMVSNMDQQNLKTGDRARMVLRYYYDASSGRMPEWSIYQVGEVIPLRDIVAKGEVDADEYQTPFVGLDYYELMDRYYNPVWVWKNRLNMNLVYKGVKENAQFAMAIRGISDGCLELDLYAKAATLGEKKSTTLLTFDLNDAETVATPEMKASARGIDSLKTRIYFKFLDDKGVVKEGDILGGKFANPFKN